ncbi:efflux transporter outer membrane subunit [Sphingosinicella sp. CPCC 101087]|uniref:efflux transporter outer membrane subunit n=1 Tax=Sphingosinicella sp. CPCC 101087 TaxID=2497754 RepID=UPI00101D7631|nr:efflux transporter outer membrane subunit [Sphingosinicella sp. CPCC 101087]
MIRPTFALTGCTALLAACTTVGPDYSEPDLPLPARFHNAAPAPAQADLAAWWRKFNDPMLDRLAERALAGNFDVQAAAARIREARAREAVAGAAGLPRMDANASAAHTRISENAVSPGDIGGGTGGQPGGPAIGLPGTAFETYRLGFDASWEIDLFGGTRRAVEAARSRTGAAIWDGRDLQVSTAAEVADSYLALRAVQQRIAIAEADLAAQQRQAQLVRARAEGGLIDGLDLRQQQAEVARAAARMPPLRAQERELIHALGILTGAEPGALYAELSSPAAVPALTPAIPVGLPSDLLRRRPDIREAERQLAAATADIGVAVAELYPRISLTAAPALVSRSLASLLEWGSRNLNASAGLAWPLFDGGRTRANVRVADARQEQALLAYRGVVLRALGDVENALSRSAEGRRQLERLEEAGRAAAAAETLAQARYRGGLVTLSDVLIARGRRLDVEEQLIESRSKLARDTVALYKALGGGWTEAEGASAAGDRP